MNKNITPILLIILAIGVYFTFTKGKIDELKAIQTVNSNYQVAIANSEKLIKVRDSVRDTYNKISPEDRERLDKMLPDNVDNVRLIIDVNGVAARHGLALKNIKTSENSVASSQSKVPAASKANKINVPSTYDTVTLNFGVSADYKTFLEFLRDLEASLRILDISKITLSANDKGIYDYGVEVKTYWLKQ